MTARTLLATSLLALAAALVGVGLASLSPAAAAAAAGLGLAVGAVLAATYRRRSEQAAGERRRLERLVDELPAAVLLFHDDALVHANPSARALLPAAGDGVGTREVLADDMLLAGVEESRETGADVEVDVRIAGRDYRARTSRTAIGEVALVILDVTEVRRLDAVRRDFVTNASHELKTPVAGIQALAESLSIALTRDPARAQQMLERLQGEATRLAQLVRDLLDLARVEEAGAQRARRVDVAEVVRGQVERLTSLAERRAVRMSVDAPVAAAVVAVPGDIQLIVANLLENAVLYNRPGGSVRVTVQRTPGEVHLHVADTGIGIPEADRARVFERFYRVDKGRSRAAGGTGLGLSLVRHAVERAGGRVLLESRVDVGSTLSVVLPVEGSGGDLTRQEERPSTRP